jgi:hypothetical protein
MRRRMRWGQYHWPISKTPAPSAYSSCHGDPVTAAPTLETTTKAG